MMARFARQPTLVGTDAAEPPHALAEGRWIDPARPNALEGVLTRSSAELLNVTLGDEVTVASSGAPGQPPSEELRIQLVGIAEQPKTLPPPKFMIGLPPTRDQALRRGPAGSALYVAKPLVERLAGSTPPQPSYVGVMLKPGVDAKAFQHRWAQDLAAVQPAVELQSLADVESEIEGSTTAETVRAQALSATGIALLAALFIIFTTLSMGVHERIRHFAVLRAVALSKAHITAIIATESIVLGLIGWGAGLLAGWGLLAVMRQLRRRRSPKPRPWEPGASPCRDSVLSEVRWRRPLPRPGRPPGSAPWMPWLRVSGCRWGESRAGRRRSACF